MQEIEPLTYQKTTNIEEHRQFLDKINEIIDNLAPTVDEAEAAIAEAARALADAVAAIATANAAADAAQAASERAAQSAATVAGYDERVTDIERTYVKNASSAPQVIDSDLHIVNGHSLSVADDVDVSGDLTVNGQAEIGGMSIEQSGSRTVLSNDGGLTVIGETIVDVPTTTTGTRDTKAVNGTRLQNDLDNYAFMFRTTGGNIAGGTNEWTGKQIVHTLGPVRTGAGSPDRVWSVMAKGTFTGTSSARLTALVTFTQSNRMALFHCNLRTHGSGPVCEVYLHKSYPVSDIAMNYDATTGEVLLLMRTPYLYQRPQLIPIISLKDDNVSGTSLDYTDTRTFTSADLFPLPSTTYATFVGVDN